MKKFTSFLLIFTFASFASNLFSATTAPTAPTNEAVDVISVYSDSYTSIATNLSPGWGQSTVFSEEDFAGNKVMKYGALNYQGLEYTNSDVSAMEYVHLDYWTADATAFQFFLIAGGENDFNVATSADGIKLSQWVSLDIPLSYFSAAGRDLTAAFQFKTVGNGTIYLDNIYFWKAPTSQADDATLSSLIVAGDTIEGFTSTKSTYAYDLPYGTTEVPTVTATSTNSKSDVKINEATSIPGATTIVVKSESGNEEVTYTVNFQATIPQTKAPVPTAAESDVIAVYSDAYTSTIATNLNPGWGQATMFSIITVDSDDMMKYANLNYQGTEYAETDVSGMEYLHFDYWTADATALEFFLISDGENSYNVATELGIKIGEWVSVDVPLTHYSGAGRDLTKAFQFKVVGDGSVCFDNYYFYKAASASIDNMTSISVSAYPNPVQDFLYFETASSVKSVDVFNLTGARMLSSTISTNRVDLSSLESGAYLVALTTDSSVKTVKIIKE